MGHRFEHPGFGVTFMLDEHGGDREERHARLYGEALARMETAVLAIAREPQYQEIVIIEDDLESGPPATCPACQGTPGTHRDGRLIAHGNPPCPGSGVLFKGSHE